MSTARNTGAEPRLLLLPATQHTGPEPHRLLLSHSAHRPEPHRLLLILPDSTPAQHVEEALQAHNTDAPARRDVEGSEVVFVCALPCNATAMVRSRVLSHGPMVLSRVPWHGHNCGPRCQW